MALINCPECGKEVSTTAVACPNCGHPLAPVERETIVRQTPPVESKSDFPNWVFIPLAVLAIIVIFLLIALLRNDAADEKTNVNIDLSTDRRAELPDSTVTRPTPQSDIIVPSNSDTSELTVPSTDSTTGGSTTTVPADSETATEAIVDIEAKVRDRSGNITSVDAEKFYILDKSLDSILREANIKPIPGQNLINSFGISVVTDRYNDIKNKSLEAIEDHIKYDTLTDSNGKAKISGAKPGQYYIFAIHKTGNGFAIWAEPITLNSGINNVKLAPKGSTEVKEQ